MGLEDAKEKFKSVKDTDDVGEKRFMMFKVFDQILSELNKESVKGLNGFDGYLYKISQDFLTSSSTYKKEQKMEKIIERVDRKYSD